jgi:hypothetical protein
MSFAFINNTESCCMLEETYKTITELELWDWLKDYHITNKGGCIFNNHPNFKLIESNQTEDIIYTGSSWNWVMNIMVYIATHDIQTFKQYYFNKKNM